MHKTSCLRALAHLVWMYLSENISERNLSRYLWLFNNKNFMLPLKYKNRSFLNKNDSMERKYLMTGF